MQSAADERNRDYKTNVVRYVRQLVDYITKNRHRITIEQLDETSKAVGYTRPLLEPVKYCYMCKKQIVRHNVINARFIGGGPIAIVGSAEVLCKECESKIETI